MDIVEFVQQFEHKVRITLKRTALEFGEHVERVYRVARRARVLLEACPAGTTSLDVPDPLGSARIVRIEGASPIELRQNVLSCHVTAMIEGFQAQLEMSLYLLAKLTVGLEEDHFLLVLPDTKLKVPVHRMYEFADRVYNAGMPRLSAVHRLFGFEEKADDSKKAAVARTRFRLMTLAVWKKQFWRVKAEAKPEELPPLVSEEEMQRAMDELKREKPELYAGLQKLLAKSDPPTPDGGMQDANTATPAASGEGEASTSGTPDSNAGKPVVMSGTRSAESQTGAEPRPMDVPGEPKTTEAEKRDFELGEKVDDYLDQLARLGKKVPALKNVKDAKGLREELGKQFPMLEVIGDDPEKLLPDIAGIGFLNWLGTALYEARLNLIRELIPGKPGVNDMEECRAFYRQRSGKGRKSTAN